MYLLKIEDDELTIHPILFKTVRNGKEYVLWQHRKTVFKLKLFDIIAFQVASWVRPSGRFYLECKDIIPPAPLDQNILFLFNLSPETSSDGSSFFKANSCHYMEYTKCIEEQDERASIERVEKAKEVSVVYSQNERNFEMSVNNETVHHPVTETHSEVTRSLTRTHTAIDIENTSIKSYSHRLSSTLYDDDSMLSKKKPSKDHYELENAFWKKIEAKLVAKDLSKQREKEIERMKATIRVLSLKKNETWHALASLARKLKAEEDSSLPSSAEKEQPCAGKKKTHQVGLIIQEVMKELDVKSSQFV